MPGGKEGAILKVGWKDVIGRGGNPDRFTSDMGLKGWFWGSIWGRT